MGERLSLDFELTLSEGSSMAGLEMGDSGELSFAVVVIVFIIDNGLKSLKFLIESHNFVDVNNFFGGCLLSLGMRIILIAALIA